MTRITKSDPWACLWRSLFRPGQIRTIRGSILGRGKVHTLDGELYAKSRHGSANGGGRLLGPFELKSALPRLGRSVR